MLPPGDIRTVSSAQRDEACSLTFFSTASKKAPASKSQLRQSVPGGADRHHTDFSEAVRLSSEILVTRATFIPHRPHIELEVTDGRRHARPRRNQNHASKVRIRSFFSFRPTSILSPRPSTPLPALISSASVRVHCSPAFIPNLLVHGFLMRSSIPRHKVYICNLMTQANESLGLTAADHIRALNRHAASRSSITR